MPFLAEYITENKKQVRSLIWGLIAPRVAYYGKGVPVMILPGQSDEEIIAARKHLNSPCITAYDIDPIAVEIARRAGVEAEKRDVISLPPRMFAVSNYDSCSLVGKPLINRLRSVAAHTTSVVGVSAVMGRWAIPQDLPTRPVPAVAEWSPARVGRIEVIAGALPDWHLCAALVYQGRRVGILSTLWCRREVVPLVRWIRDDPNSASSRRKKAEKLP